MINHLYVNLETIIERVKKDLPPGIEVNEEDVVEYIWEALAKIGAPDIYVTLYSLLAVENYKTQLPGWIQKLNSVRYISRDITLIDDEEAINIAAKSGYIMETVIDTFDLSSNVNNLGKSLGYRYVVKDRYIHTTFEEGIIEISYDAFPLDEQARPVIPQHIYFIEAVKWYIINRYLWRMMVRDTTWYDMYILAEREWLHYCNAASTVAKIPNKDGLFALMNKFLRILPNLHRNFRFTYYKDPVYTKDDLSNLIYY
jgi:hypothetical protein